jgi:predicted transcriptional regulator YdeE
VSIETIKLGEMHVIGILVEAHWRDLGRVIPKAWATFFARRPELDPSCGPLGENLEVSLSWENDRYRELVGCIVGKDARAPEGMVKITIPANSYLKLEHAGPLAGIAAGFKTLLDHAMAQGIDFTDVKLDIGYSPGLPAGRHELYIGIEPWTEIEHV